jgi:hypothetical protein
MDRLRVVLAVLVGTTWLAAAAVTYADNPGIGQVIVPGDHVTPGETFQITGYDLDPAAYLAFKLTSGTSSIEVGMARVGDDGTIAKTATLPASFPLGYAQLLATSDGGGQWSTSVLVGERAEGPGSQAAVDDGIAGRLAGLVLLTLGVVIFSVAGLRYMRR